jgi:SAM-dependent methyltransferase
VEHDHRRPLAVLEEVDAAAANRDAVPVHDRDDSGVSWDTTAGAWERNRARMWEATRAVGEGLVEMAAPRPGEVVLELAGGAGDTGLLALDRVGARGRLILSDESTGMLAAARRNAEARGGGTVPDNVDLRQIDAEAIDLPDGSVDAVLCRWGYMLMDDPVRALSETRRILRRPGGRVALAVWGPRDRNPWNTVTGGPLAERGLVPDTPPDAPGMYRLADPGELERLLRSAGFTAVELRELPVMWRFHDLDEQWALVTDISPSLKVALERIPSDQHASLRADVAARCEPYRTDDGYELPGVSIGALAS